VPVDEGRRSHHPRVVPIRRPRSHLLLRFVRASGLFDFVTKQVSRRSRPSLLEPFSARDIRPAVSGPSRDTHLQTVRHP